MKRFKGSHHGTLPMNARITIDYSSGQVRFSYPRKMDFSKAKQRAFVQLYIALLLPWMFINGIGVLVYAAIQIATQWSVVSAGLANIGQLDFWTAIQPMLLPLAFAVYFFGTPMVVSWVIVGDERRLQRWFPKINAKVLEWLKSGRYEAVFRKTVNRTVEIPMFNNVILDYRAVGDFGRNLQRIEIREHPFRVKRRGKDLPNEYLWKASFLFTKDCSCGYLKVSFV